MVLVDTHWAKYLISQMCLLSKACGSSERLCNSVDSCPSSQQSTQAECVKGSIPSWLSDIKQKTSSHFIVLYCEWTPNA